MKPHAQSLYSAQQTRELDRTAIEHGMAGMSLMERAGRAAWIDLVQRWPRARAIVVVCGKGNNGGDGYVIARLAHAAGREVKVVTLADDLQGDAATARAKAVAAGVPMQAWSDGAIGECEVLVDGVFGTGLERPVAGVWRDAVEAINRHPAPVLALDIPSGLSADTGTVLGVAVKAEMTVSFIGLNIGLFTGAGPEYAGRVVFDGLDVSDAVYAQVAASAGRVSAKDCQSWLPRRARDAHKGKSGRVLVVGGNAGYCGAPLMSGMAAVRSGAGLVSVAVSPECAHTAGLHPELMLRGVEQVDELTALARANDVLALGPGLGRSSWSKAAWERLIGFPRPMVLDADGLNLLAESPRRRDDWVLTPHPGEAARLLACGVGEIQMNRIAAAREIAARFGGVCVLKGAGTLIHTSGERPWVIDRGGPVLASGGTGDVLCGLIAALIAQGVSSFHAAAAGAWCHAVAGEEWQKKHGELGLNASSLLEFICKVLNNDYTATN